MNPKGYRRLAAAVIRDAFKLGDQLPKNEARLTKERICSCMEAREWLLSPNSNLDLFAGLLGHSPSFYARKARARWGAS